MRVRSRGDSFRKINRILEAIRNYRGIHFERINVFKLNALDGRETWRTSFNDQLGAFPAAHKPAICIKQSAKQQVQNKLANCELC